MKSIEKNLPEDFYVLEEKLKNTFRPIKPDPQYISKVQARLFRANEISIDRQKRGRIVFVLSAGLILGLLVLYFFRQED